MAELHAESEYSDADDFLAGAGLRVEFLREFPLPLRFSVAARA